MTNKQHKLGEIIIATIGSVLMFIALYYFVKAIVCFDN
jgi:hypothetical protein